MTKKAFTLVELVVAVALLAMVISFSSVIFKVSIDSHRTAVANVEIMQKLRAITEQLNADFKGLQKDAPLLIWFDQNDANDPDPRFDQIMFFTVGDFQSSQLYYSQQPTNEYDKDYKYVRGNAARVYYGLAESRDPDDNVMKTPYDRDLDPEARVLARRQHILTADGDLYEWPVDPNGSNFDFEEPISVGGKSYEGNEIFEHDTMSLTHWKNLDSGEYSGGSGILKKCFYNRSGSNGFPQFDSRDPNTFHKLLCQGVASFAVQWYYEDFNEPRWFPSADPDNDGDIDDTDLKGNDRDFGAFFNTPGSLSGDWKSVRNPADFSGFDSTADDITPNNSNKGFFPEALKFTFRLVDSQGIITETDPQGSPRPGRTFTHIVYLKE